MLLIEVWLLTAQFICASQAVRCPLAGVWGAGLLGQRCQAGGSPGGLGGSILSPGELGGSCSLLVSCQKPPKEMQAAARALLMVFVNPEQEKLKMTLFQRALAAQRGLTLANAGFE